MVETDEMKPNDKITVFGFSSFFVTLMSSGFLGMGSYIIFSLTNIDSYISAILGMILGFIPHLIFMYIMNHSDNKDIIDLNISLFGKPIGITLNVVLNAVVIFMSIISLYNISQFVDIQYMPETESVYLKILILLPIAYAASKSIATITKISQVFLFTKIGFVIITIIGLLKSIDITLVHPIMKNGVTPTFIGALVYMIFLTYPLLLLTIIPKNQIVEEKHQKRKMLVMFLVANLLVIVRFFLVTVVLGEDIIPMLRYPEYIVLKKFKLFSLIERVENILALYFVFNNIMYQIVSFYFIIASLKKIKIFKKVKNENVYPYILATLVLISATLIFKNTVQAANIIKNYVPYIIVCGIFVPVLVTFFALLFKKFSNFKNYIKQNINNSNTNSSNKLLKE